MRLLQSRFRLLDARCPIEWTHPLNRGLIANWAYVPLSGWNSNIAHDLVRGGLAPHDGTLSGGVSWVGLSPAPTGTGGSLKFDGATGYVDCGTSATLMPTAMSVSCWVNTTSLVSAFQAAVSKTNNTNYAQLMVKSTGKLAVYLSVSAGGGSVSYNGTGAYVLSIRKWYHLVFTYNATVGLVGYVNAAVDNTAAASGNITPNTVQSLTIGADTFDGGRLWTGYINSVCIYNRALTAREVRTLYHQEQRGNPDRWRWI